jgi:hypothetical protein
MELGILELLGEIVGHELAVDHGREALSHFVGADESHRARSPATGHKELSIVLTMLAIGWIKSHQGTFDKF